MGKKEHPSPHGTWIYVIKYDAYKKLEQVTCTSYKLTEQGICTSHKLNSGHICTSYTLSKDDTCTSYTLPYICTSYKIPKTLNKTSEFHCAGNRNLNDNDKTKDSNEWNIFSKISKNIKSRASGIQGVKYTNKNK